MEKDPRISTADCIILDNPIGNLITCDSNDHIANGADHSAYATNVNGVGVVVVWHCSEPELLGRVNFVDGSWV